VREELRQLMAARDLDDSAIGHWRTLIVGTGAVEWVEGLIDARLQRALQLIDTDSIKLDIRNTLADMAVNCAERAA
jgi:geranylgeranyl diphosphate synthase type I